MSKIKKYSDAKKSNVRKISSARKNTKGEQAEIVQIEQRIDEKINDTIKKRLGSYVKEMQILKARQKKLAAHRKAGNPVGISKKNKKPKH